MPISNQRKAVIHVAKKQLAMTAADYRALLQHAAGVSSSAALDDVGFDAVMAEFERLGFRSAKHRTPAARREGMATPAQIGKIRALWKAYSGADNETSLEHWLEVHLHASSLMFLDASRAGKAIGILEKMVAGRREKRARSEETVKEGEQ